MSKGKKPVNEWEMPFGKNKGKSLGDMALDKDDRGYLSWLEGSLNDGDNLKGAIRMVLDGKGDDAFTYPEKEE
jgi:hypothetical protein